MKTENRFFVKEFHPGLWWICDRQQDDQPICDGDGMSFVYRENDAIEACEAFNEAEKFDETRR